MSKAKEVIKMCEAMYQHNGVVLWSTGEVEGIAVTALDKKAAEKRFNNTVVKKAKEIGDKKYRVLTKSDFDDLTPPEKQSVKDDWKHVDFYK